MLCRRLFIFILSLGFAACGSSPSESQRALELEEVLALSPALDDGQSGGGGTGVDPTPTPGPTVTPPMSSIFTTKTTAQGLAGNDVKRILVAGTKLYVATGNGLSISSNAAGTFLNKTTAHGLLSNQVNSVAVDPSTVGTANVTLMAATAGGVGVSYNDGGDWTKITTNEGLQTNVVSDVAVINGNKVASNDLLSFLNDAGTGVARNMTLGNNTIRDIWFNGVVLWLAAADGVHKVDPASIAGSVHITPAGNGLASVNVRAIEQSGTKLYAATDAGVSVSEDGGLTFTTMNTTQGIVSNDVISIHAQGDILAVGTSAGLSLSLDGGQTFVNYTTAQGLPSNLIQAVFIDSSGMRLYVGTPNGLSYMPL